MRPLDVFEAPKIESDTWLNSKPIKPEELKGKVCLVYFFSIGEPSALTEVPHLRYLHRKLQGKLQIIGVHVPKYERDEEKEFVQRALKGLEIEFPVVLDNEMKIWNGFRNQFWGQMHFVDGGGKVRSTHAGDKAAEEIEKDILFLLGQADIEADLRPGLGEMALEGDWYVGEDSAEHTSEEEDAITLRYEGRSLAIGVIAEKPVQIRVLLDGKPVPRSSAGDDLSYKGKQSVLEVVGERHLHVVKEDMERMREATFLVRAKGVKVTGFLA